MSKNAMYTVVSDGDLDRVQGLEILVDRRRVRRRLHVTRWAFVPPLDDWRFSAVGHVVDAQEPTTDVRHDRDHQFTGDIPPAVNGGILSLNQDSAHEGTADARHG